MIRGFLVIFMLISSCSSPNQVTVELTPTAATQGSYGVGTVVNLYPLAPQFDAAGNTQWVWPDEPALTAVTGPDMTVVFDWDASKPFRIATNWESIGGDCWTSASENFIAGGAHVEAPLYIACA